MKIKITVFSILLLLSFSSIYAGGVIKTKYTDGNGSEQSTNTIMVQDGLLRMEMVIDDKTQIIIFDSEDEVFYQIIDSEKKYITFSKDDLERASKEIDEGMEMLGSITKGASETLPGVAEDVASFFGAKLDADKEVEKAVGNLKGEDQKIAKDAMAGNLKGYVDDKIDKPEYAKVESGVDVNGYRCSKYVGTVEDKMVEEIWIADFENVELGNELTSVFDKLESFIEVLAKPNDKLSQGLYEGVDGWFIEKGIPVKQISYKDGNVISKAIVEEISSKELDEDLFDTPSGYKKENPFRTNMDDMFNKFKSSH